jgi:hypothetical protein
VGIPSQLQVVLCALHRAEVFLFGIYPYFFYGDRRLFFRLYYVSRVFIPMFFFDGDFFSSEKFYVSVFFFLVGKGPSHRGWPPQQG